MYILFNGNYTFKMVPQSNSNIQIEYLNNGYHNKIEKYSLENSTTVSISDFNSKLISVSEELDAEHSNDVSAVDATDSPLYPLKTWDQSELDILNAD